MTTPYDDCAPHHFWRSGVAEVHPTGFFNLYEKKFSILDNLRIATAGSCFAQHVARHLKSHNFNVVDAEPSPLELPDGAGQKFGYGVYSARYGNLYTARQLLQLLKDARSGAVREEDVWEKDGRFFDALRPSVEPDGLDSPKEVAAHRREHLAAVDQLFSNLDVLIFTMGLTETWINRRTGTVYPTCPGVIAGAFNPEVHSFKNFEFEDIFADMIEVERILKLKNPGLKIILTVSPVPLTATASGDHVLAATTYSKSTLRAVCGSLRSRLRNVDYFPSYEIITSPSSRGLFYEPNLRSVTDIGVETVMKTFFLQHKPSARTAEVVPRRRAGGRKERKGPRRGKNRNDLVCEEVLLEAFAK